jgi:AraC-like DNA-binding protein
MPLQDSSVATVGQIIWRLIERYGLAPEPIFLAAGVDPQIIRDPHARIPSRKMDALRHAVAARIADPAFLLQAAHCWHPSNLGALGYAWLSSSTLRRALERLVRYSRLLSAGLTATLAEVPDGVEYVHVPPPTDAVGDRVDGDGVLAIITDMCRTNFGGTLNPLRVAFHHAAPADAGPYEAFFRCPVSFGADANRILISRADADYPLPTGNRELAAVHDRILVEELARLDRKNVKARIRASLLERMASGELSEEDAARDLNMSRRSLQRRLAESDATYQSLLDDTRRDLALRYIQDPARSATDITFLLGYSQQSALTRAFKRWTGLSPSQYRSRKSPATT